MVNLSVCQSVFMNKKGAPSDRVGQAKNVAKSAQDAMIISVRAAVSQESSKHPNSHQQYENSIQQVQLSTVPQFKEYKASFFNGSGRDGKADTKKDQKYCQQKSQREESKFIIQNQYQMVEEGQENHEANNHGASPPRETQGYQPKKEINDNIINQNRVVIGEPKDISRPEPSQQMQRQPYKSLQTERPVLKQELGMNEEQKYPDPDTNLTPNSYQFVSVKDINLKNEDRASIVSQGDQMVAQEQEADDSVLQKQNILGGQANQHSSPIKKNNQLYKMGDKGAQMSHNRVLSGSSQNNMSDRKISNMKPSQTSRVMDIQGRGGLLQAPQQFLGHNTLRRNVIAQVQSAKFLNGGNQKRAGCDQNFSSFNFNQVLNQGGPVMQQQIRGSIPYTGGQQYQAANRYPIIDSGMSAQQIPTSITSNYVGSSGPSAAPGRRLDQVQTRRRRMKNARHMKVLYHHVTGVLSCQQPSDRPKSAQFKMKLIDVLIDLKISIEKIDHNIILSEEGHLYQVEGQGGSGVMEGELLNHMFNDSYSHSNNQSYISHSSGIGGQASSPRGRVNSSGWAAETKVTIQQLKLIKDCPPSHSISSDNNKADQRNKIQQRGQRTHQIDNVLPPGQPVTNHLSENRNDKIKDIAVTQNGLVYVSEKGEVHLAVALQSDMQHQSSINENPQNDFLNLIYQRPSNNFISIDDRHRDHQQEGRESIEEGSNRGSYEEMSVSSNNPNVLRAQHFRRDREGSEQLQFEGDDTDNRNQIPNNISQQAPLQPQIPEPHLPILPAARPSATSYKQTLFSSPLLSRPLRQIQTTFISKVACGREHTLLLTSSGFVYSMGRNEYGQLGRELQLVPNINLGNVNGLAQEQRLGYNESGLNGDQQEAQEMQERDQIQNAGEHQQSECIFAPQMIFGLLNTKVTDIQCGAYHNVVVGTPRSSTSAALGHPLLIGPGGASHGMNQGSGALMGGLAQRGTHGSQGASMAGLGYHGYSSYQQSNNLSRQKQMVFSWGCNTNHQLGLFQLRPDQACQVNEPTLIEELLQFSHIRKVKCDKDRTMILVDEPNTLLIFCKREKPRARQSNSSVGARVVGVGDDNGIRQEEGKHEKPRRGRQGKDMTGEANVQEDSPEQNYVANQIDEREEVSGQRFKNIGERVKHAQIEQSSIYQIQPMSDHHSTSSELIVDFELQKSDQMSNHADEQALSNSNMVLVYSTHRNNVYQVSLSIHNNQEVVILYNNQVSKSLIGDHYIFQIHYLPGCDKLFSVSQMRPDLLHQSLMQDQMSQDGSGLAVGSYGGAQGGAGVGTANNSQSIATGGYGPGAAQQFNRFDGQNLGYSSHLQAPQLPYPFERLNYKDVGDGSDTLGRGGRGGRMAAHAASDDDDDDDYDSRIDEHGKSKLFGGSNLSSVPKTLGSVFSQEWRDLLKFIAVSKGSTKVPQGLGPMSYRPANLPQKSEAELTRVNQLVEENRQLYIKKQQEKNQKMAQKFQMQLQKEEKMAKIWEKEILTDWDNLKSTARVRELWTDGIPKRIRSIVWYRALGNKSVVTRDLFNIMAERGRKLSELLTKHQQIENEILENRGQPQDVEQKIQNLKQSQAGGDQQSSSVFTAAKPSLSTTYDDQQDSEILEELYLKYHKIRKKLLMLIQIDSQNYQVLAREKSISLIEQDIKRTFADLNLFQEGMKYHDNILKILRAFAMYRPDIGYVQGMSYIAGIVILYIQDEYKSFMSFSNLMLRYPIMPFYTFNEEFVTKVLQLFKQLFQINLPDLCDHFEMEEIKPRQYVYKWIMTLFSTQLPLKIVSHVWDLYFLDGIFILYQTSIAILRLLRPLLLQNDMEGILNILQNIQEHITEDEQDKLVDSIFDMVYPQWVYEEIPKLEIEYQKLI